MNSGQHPRPRTQRPDIFCGTDHGDPADGRDATDTGGPSRPDVLGGPDTGSEDILAGAGTGGPSRPDVLGGPDTGSEDILAGAGTGGPGTPDVLGGPDTGPEDILAVPGAGAPPGTPDEPAPGESPRN